MDIYNFPVGKVKKLVSSLFEKKQQVLQYKNLQFYLKLGMKMKKVHRKLNLVKVICFLNVEKRVFPVTV